METFFGGGALAFVVGEGFTSGNATIASPGKDVFHFGGYRLNFRLHLSLKLIEGVTCGQNHQEHPNYALHCKFI